MRGIQSSCYICGASGEVFGCPSWFDACVDRDACRRRAVANRDAEIEKQNQRIKELEKQLAAVSEG